MIKVNDTFLRPYANYLLYGLMTLVVIGVPLSLARIPITGFQPEHTLHIVTMVFTSVVFYQRHKMSALWIVLFAMLIFITVAFAAVASNGLASPFALFAALAAAIVTLVYGLLRGAVFITVFFIIALLIGGLHINGYLSPDIDYNLYNKNWVTWTLASSVSLMMILMMLVILGNLKKQLLQTIEELEQEKLKAEQRANHDTLTGLLSLHMANDRMELAIKNAKRNKTKVAIIFLDLDNFKSINDDYGHDAGDCVLIEVAKRLKSCIREVDSACRIGGDEFFIVMAEVHAGHEVGLVCERIINSVGHPIDYQGQTLHIELSAGIALYPDHALDSSKLKNMADRAMYKVKQRHTHSYAFSPKSEQATPSS